MSRYSDIDVYASISGEARRTIASWSSERVDAAHERDTATSWRPVRARKRERQADIYGRGVREALKLRLLATALVVFTMMFGVSLSLSLSPLSIWEFHLFSPLVASSTPSFFDASRALLLRAGHQKYRRLFRGWERRGGPREKNRREALFRDFIGDCRLSGIVPIVSIPNIKRVL